VHAAAAAPAAPRQGHAGEAAKSQDITDGCTLQCRYIEAEGNMGNLVMGGCFGGRRFGGGRRYGGCAYKHPAFDRDFDLFFGI
jgi:hypothetical protein